MTLSEQASKDFNSGFVNCFYIGRIQIRPKEECQPHKFYYIGYGDVFGVSMPEPNGRRGFQIWYKSWVAGRSDKLDKALKAAMRGKFPECRHNYRLRKGADSHETTFIKPSWLHQKEAPAIAQENGLLPIRGKRKLATRKKLQRRQLLV